MLTIELKSQIHFSKIMQAIKLCLENSLLAPALILIYSGIDNIAWCANNSDSIKTREYFTKWVEKFMKPENNLGCSSIDLYNARCGIVHASKAESDHSIKGKAKEIHYCFGNASPEKMTKVVEILGESNKVINIHIQQLYDCYKDSVQKYLSYLELAENITEKERFKKKFVKVLIDLDPIGYDFIDKNF
jgi:hypothetical protein